MSGFAVAMTTAGSAEAGRRVSRALVEARLAGCVQAWPIASTYRWEGRVVEEPEVLLLAKIRAEDAAAVEAAILAAHDYDTPEVIVVPVERGSAGYLAWLAEATGRPD